MHKLGMIAILSVVLTLASGPVAVSGGTVSVKDMAGRSVEAPHDPDRIICLGPGALRLIVYLQARDKVVAVESMEKMNPGGRPYWIASPELHDLPSCGPGGPASINKKPDLEAVLRAEPQVIFVTYMDAPLADEVQETLGIPVVVLSYGVLGTFDEAVFDALRIAGKVLNRQERAEAVIDYVNSLREDLQRRTADVEEGESPRVYAGGIGHRGAHGIESTEKHYIPFDWINVNNLADEVEAGVGSHVFVDKELFLELNPDIIFIDGGGLALVKEDYRKKTEYYEALEAVRSGKVYTLLPFNWYTTNIGTALADAYAVGKIVYPERFADVDPEKKADAIYTFLTGKPVYSQMKADFGAIGQVAPFVE